MAAPLADRRTAFLDRLPADCIGAVIPPGSTFRYLTGIEMPATERPVLVVLDTDAGATVVTPGVYAERFHDQLDDNVATHVYDESADPVAAAGKALETVIDYQAGAGSVGFSFRTTRLYDYSMVADAIAWDRVIDVDTIADELRRQKDRTEQDHIREGARMAEAVLQAVVDTVEPGMTEHEVDRIMRSKVVEIGAEAESLRSVSSGPRTADPIGHPSDREIEAGDPLMLDVGLIHEGYVADVTRTVAVGGSLSPDLQEIHETVQAAAEHAREVAGPGVACEAVDRAGREIIEDAGFADAFVHRIGHGLGLDPHEAPYLEAGNSDVLYPGDVCTVEPGIYVEGVGGVRIEDELLVTDAGVEVMTGLGRGPQPNF